MADPAIRNDLARSVADEYERHQTWAPETREEVARHLRASVKQKRARCLFLGCGSGVNEVLPFAHEAPSGTEIVAGDIEASCLRRLREHVRDERLSNVEVRRLDVTEDLSALGTFDLVTLLFVVHRLPTWRPVVRRLADLLRPGGSFWISEFAGPGGVIYLANRGGGTARNAIARVIRRHFELQPPRAEPELRSTSIGPVLKEFGRLLRPAGRRDVLWRQTLTVGDMLDKIEKRAYAPFWESGRASFALERLRAEFEWERSRRVSLVERIRLYRFVRS